MRQLKHHEKKLLKKVNLDEWNSKREQLVCTKYLLHDRNTYVKYNIIVGKIRKLTESLARLNYTTTNISNIRNTTNDKNNKNSSTNNTANNIVIKEYIGKKLINKLYDMGIIEEKKLSECLKITVSDFCKRRLPIVIAHKKMVENYKDADKFVQHGHIKVGTEVVSDPSILISKSAEEYIKWKEGSKIKRKLDEIHGDVDDFEYL
ncbi:IMP3 [Ecytonucleospora hepatopenaei]|uniref:IMP3 n=1 Tax=Ecytonucleospora hepatopenaei TaxID=646526 RepID=A0A1W0E3Y8_9MICR|nr:IMP3 [Ecytonucleospora hepatopenaei]